MTWPVAGGLTFQYEVDSAPGQPGLSLSIDGIQQLSLSGRGQRGKQALTVPAGTHTVRFTFTRSGVASPAQERAWLDDVQLVAGSVLERHNFNERVLDVPPSGWTSGGNGGPWGITTPAVPVGLRRSAAIAGQGYQPAPRVAAIERTYTWPAGSVSNSVVVAYAVDSEADKDVFRVLIDGVEKAIRSGRAQRGNIRIPIASAGTHSVRFEYRKDESIDEGADDARVLAWSFETDGRTLASSLYDPSRLGTVPDDWQVPNGAAYGWVLAPEDPPRIYVTPYAGAGATQPIVDGIIEPERSPGSSREYLNVTKLNLGHYGAPGGKAGELWLTRSSSNGTLNLGVRIAKDADGARAEAGRLILYIDAAHAETLRGAGCSSNVDRPAPTTVKLVLDYDGNQPPAQRFALQQFLGTCLASVPWQTSPVSANWTWQAAFGEPGLDPMFANLELALRPPTGSLAAGADRLGFGLKLEGAGVDGVRYHVPRADGRAPRDTSLGSLGSLRFYPMSQDRALPSEIGRPVDGAPRR